jgi:hypothetical protein
MQETLKWSKMTYGNHENPIPTGKGSNIFNDTSLIIGKDDNFVYYSIMTLYSCEYITKTEGETFEKLVCIIKNWFFYNFSSEKLLCYYTTDVNEKDIVYFKNIIKELNGVRLVCLQTENIPDY